MATSPPADPSFSSAAESVSARGRLERFFWPVCAGGSGLILMTGFLTGYGLIVLPALSTALLIGLTLLERRIPIDANHSFGNDPQSKNDVAHLLLGSAGGEALGNTLVVGGAVALGLWAPTTFHIWPTSLPIWLQVVLMFVIADLLEYGRHRAEHRIPWLWKIHALHHDTDRLHAIKSSRNHLLDILTRYLCVYAPLAIVGVPPLWLPAYAAAILVVGPLSHANLDLDVPRWCHRVLATPPVHAIHHGLDHPYSDSNFAPVSPVWDQIFGTYTHPDEVGQRPAAFGIEGEAWPNSFWGQIAAPFWRPK